MEVQQKEIERSIKLWPLMYTVSCDLIFFWVINVTFLTLVKGLSYAEFFALDVIGSGVSLVLSYPLLLLISKIGNNLSFKIGSLCLIVCVVLYIFGDDFIWFVIANCIYFISHQFFVVTPNILNNNLGLVGRKNEFIKYSARGRLGYSILTLVITLIAGMLFDVNAYIPMYLCLLFTILSLIISFFVHDQSKIKYQVYKPVKRLEITEKRPKAAVEKNSAYLLISLLLFIIIFKGCLYIGSQYTKISLQEIGTAITIISVVLFIARGGRVIVNLFAEKMIKKHEKALMFVLPGILVMSFLLMSLPIILFESFILQFIFVSLGVILVTSFPDLYVLYYQHIIVTSYKKEKHLKIFWIIEFFKTAGLFICNLIITLLSLKFNPEITLVILTIFLSTIFVASALIKRFWREEKLETNQSVD